MGHPDPVPGGFRRPALRAARRLPAWREKRNPAQQLPTFLTGRQDCIVPHTPRYFSHQAPLAYDFDPDAPEPKAWLKFLHEDLWPGDPDSVACLQR
jgi:hypothetical protein